MAHVYVDEDVSVDVATILAQRQHTATTVRDAGLRAEHDGRQLWEATHRRAILVSHNAMDFRLLHRSWRCWATAWQVHQQHGGILILPHGDEGDSVERLEEFLQVGWPIVNQVYRYDSQRGWEPYD